MAIDENIVWCSQLEIGVATTFSNPVSNPNRIIFFMVVAIAGVQARVQVPLWHQIKGPSYLMAWAFFIVDMIECIH